MLAAPGRSYTACATSDDPPMRDEDVRTSCFGQLAVLCAQFGEDVPYRGGLDAGFAFRGRRVPYLSPQKGIFRAAAQQVLVAPGTMIGPVDELEPTLPEDPIERRYAVRDVRVRIHQARFRGRVVPAYRGQCAICRLKEVRLLDAAHIVSDVEERGDPVVSNGLALCSIHHRAFDHDLVAVSPDYEVRVSERLLHDEDGPMLELLKTFDRNSIYVPRMAAWRPDRERLAARYERFLTTSAR